MATKWQQHLECCRIIRMHPDWTDEQVLDEADMRMMEVNIVKEARREVQNTEADVPGVVRSKRSY